MAMCLMISCPTRRIRGAAQWFDAGKGFDFIKPDDGGQDAFVHATAVRESGLDDLREGDRISYELDADRRSGRLKAVRLKWATPQ